MFLNSAGTDSSWGWGQKKGAKKLAEHSHDDRHDDRRQNFYSKTEGSCDGGGTLSQSYSSEIYAEPTFSSRIKIFFFVVSISGEKAAGRVDTAKVARSRSSKRFNI